MCACMCVQIHVCMHVVTSPCDYVFLFCILECVCDLRWTVYRRRLRVSNSQLCWNQHQVTLIINSVLVKINIPPEHCLAMLSQSPSRKQPTDINPLSV